MEDPEELSSEELAAQEGQAVPDREAMSVLNADIAGIDNFAMPINEALALNYESTQSVAYADADQTVIIGQVDHDAEPAAAAPLAAEGAAAEPAPTADDGAAAEPAPIAEEAPAPINEEAPAPIAEGTPPAEEER